MTFRSPRYDVICVDGVWTVHDTRAGAVLDAQFADRVDAGRWCSRANRRWERRGKPTDEEGAEWIPLS